MQSSRLAHLSDRLGQRNFLRANFDAVLDIAAVSDPTLAHQRLQTLRRVELD